MRPQIIERDSEPEWAVVPYEDYLRLVEAKEMLDDITAFDAAVAATEEETVPHAVIKRLIGGENPVRVWREHRGMTRPELAASAGIRQAYLSRIEGGKRVGSPRVLNALAQSLGVAIEDLLEEIVEP